MNKPRIRKIHITLSLEEFSRLQSLAEQEGRSLSAQIGYWIRQLTPPLAPREEQDSEA